MSNTPVYVSPFTGTVVTPTDVSYYALSFSANTQLYWPAVVNTTQVPAARIIDATPSTFGLEVILPEADQGTVGADILIRNFGSNSFLVANYGGTPSVTVAPGAAIYFYLSDNTSPAGVWHNVTFGTGASSADAATLQGAGLTTINGTLATTQNIVDVAVSNPVINDASRASTFVWTGGLGSFTLPSISSLSNGWYVGFRNSGSGALTISPITPTLINGASSIVANPGDSGFIFYDTTTTSFITVGFAAPYSITFTSGTYDVDSISGNTLNLSAFAPIIQTYISQSGSRSNTLAVTLPATTQMYILTNNTNSSVYDITFQLQGSSQTPFILASGKVVSILSNGTTITPLTQASITSFFAANGSQALPSYSFANDTHTGMYLDTTSVLGLSANSIEMLRIDNSNTMTPLITTPAQLNAGLISGGTF
jgi:hypothetical protein